MRKILIIDDDPEFVSNTKQLLEANSYEVVSAGSGKEGIAKAEAESPDLIIIDVIMETWGEGFTVIDKLRENEKNRDIPKILLTALGLKSPLDPVTPEMMGVKFVLQKPLKPATLLECVGKALGA
jgi:CheY-like chemotaxis protein